METVKIGAVDCRIVRRDRRSVCFRCAKDGTPEILVPKRISEAKIQEIILPYTTRIEAEYERQKKLIESRKSFSLDYGMAVRFLGSEREIRADDSGRRYIDVEAIYLPAMLTFDEIKSAVKVLYKQYAKKYIMERTAVIAAKMGLSPNAVKIGSATSHWGSCSKKGSLNFSWFCIMASPEAVDYIIIHELCHMREFNHSARFWENVSVYCPEYKRCREYLKSLWRDILSENWGK